jgi:hypothetical protein
MEAVHRRTGEGLVRGCACGDRDGVASGTTGIAHVSCLAEQAKILFEEAERNNLDVDVKLQRLVRWYTCSLCEQEYHGDVRCALGWACWKTYLGRPETDKIRAMAMTRLGNGLCAAGHDADALSVLEAELSLQQRLGASEYVTLITQSNLANTYQFLRRDEALQMRRDVYSGTSKLCGEESEDTITEASNLANLLVQLQRCGEAKQLLRKTMPIARRILGESEIVTLRMKWNYAVALCNDRGATLDDFREAVATLEGATPIARRVLGNTHPLTSSIERVLQRAREIARAALHAHETPPVSA